MKYKPGDKVRIKSIDWYNQNKAIDGDVLCFENIHKFTSLMSSYCGKVVTISTIITGDGEYFIEEDGEVNWWTDDMIEGLALEKGSELPSVVYIPYIIEDSPALETSTELCPKIEVPTRYYDEVKYEPQEKMVSLEDVCEFLDEHLYTRTSDGDYDYGQEYICSDFDNATDLIFALRKVLGD